MRNCQNCKCRYDNGYMCMQWEMAETAADEAWTAMNCNRYVRDESVPAYDFEEMEKRMAFDGPDAFSQEELSAFIHYLEEQV